MPSCNMKPGESSLSAVHKATAPIKTVAMKVASPIVVPFIRVQAPETIGFQTPVSPSPSCDFLADLHTPLAITENVLLRSPSPTPSSPLIWSYDSCDDSEEVEPVEQQDLDEKMKFRIKHIPQCCGCAGYLVCEECIGTYNITLPKQYGCAQGDTWSGYTCTKNTDNSSPLSACSITLCSLCYKTNDDGKKQTEGDGFFVDSRDDICPGCMVAIDQFDDDYDEHAPCGVCSFTRPSE
jgi:hypothetical protein